MATTVPAADAAQISILLEEKGESSKSVEVTVEQAPPPPAPVPEEKPRAYVNYGDFVSTVYNGIGLGVTPCYHSGMMFLRAIPNLFWVLATFTSTWTTLMQPGISFGLFIRAAVDTGIVASWPVGGAAPSNAIPLPVLLGAMLIYAMLILALIAMAKTSDRGARMWYRVLSLGIGSLFALAFAIAVIVNAATALSNIRIYPFGGYLAMVLLCAQGAQMIMCVIGTLDFSFKRVFTSVFGPFLSYAAAPLTIVVLPLYSFWHFVDLSWGGRDSRSGVQTRLPPNDDRIQGFGGEDGGCRVTRLSFRMVSMFLIIALNILACLGLQSMDLYAIVVALLLMVASSSAVHVCFAVANFPFRIYRFIRNCYRGERYHIEGDVFAWIMCYSESQVEIRRTAECLKQCARYMRTYSPEWTGKLRVVIVQDGKSWSRGDGTDPVAAAYNELKSQFDSGKPPSAWMEAFANPAEAPMDMEIFGVDEPDDPFSFLVVAKEINRRKRDSLLLTMSLFFGELRRHFDTVRPDSMDKFTCPEFTLGVDMDTNMREDAVAVLYRRMRDQPLLGGVCGIMDVGIHAVFPDVLWEGLQYFEFSLGHALFKSGEDFSGAVTCLPGACSMYRISALRSVARPFSRIPYNIFEANCIEQGEDRYLTTLLLLRGWMTGYEPNARCETNLLTDIQRYMEQRRRWNNSTIANQAFLLWNTFSFLKPGNPFGKEPPPKLEVIVTTGMATPRSMAVTPEDHDMPWMRLSPSGPDAVAARPITLAPPELDNRVNSIDLRALAQYMPDEDDDVDDVPETDLEVSPIIPAKSASSRWIDVAGTDNARENRSFSVVRAPTAGDVAQDSSETEVYELADGDRVTGRTVRMSVPAPRVGFAAASLMPTQPHEERSRSLAMFGDSVPDGSGSGSEKDYGASKQDAMSMPAPMPRRQSRPISQPISPTHMSALRNMSSAASMGSSLSGGSEELDMSFAAEAGRRMSLPAVEHQ